MKMSYLKRILSFVCIFGILLGITMGCSSPGSEDDASPPSDTADQDPTEPSETEDPSSSENEDVLTLPSGSITVWGGLDYNSFERFTRLYHEINPNVSVDAVTLQGDQYMTKLQGVLTSGSGVPDVMLFESRDLGSFMQTDYIANLSESPYNGDSYSDDMVPYVDELSRDADGNLRALSFQSAPGGYWYNKQLAEKYLGTTDPEEIHELTKDWDTLIQTGKMVYEKSGGEVSLLDTHRSATDVMLDQRTSAYVDENNKLYDPQLFRDCFTIAKELRDNNVDAKLVQWDPGWNAAIYLEPSFIILGMPSWSLHACIYPSIPEEADADDIYDTWGFAQSPEPFYLGGTWMTIYSDSKNKEAAWDFVRTTTADERFLVPYVEETGDMVAYIPAIEEIIDSGFTDPLLGEQKIYKDLYHAAMDATAKPITSYDNIIYSTFQSVTELLLDGQLDVDGAMDAFIKDVQTQAPGITVE